MMMSRRRLFFCGCCTVIVLLIQVSVQATNPSPQLQTTNQPFHGHVISNFLNHRCGSSFKDSSRQSVWTYEGALSDPLTGKVIAEVEGLEVVKQLPTITSSKSSDKALLNNLCTKHVLFPKQKTQSSQPSWDTATTILSRKLFCYRRPSNMNNASGKVDSESPSKSLLTSLRLRPDGPLRHLSPLENMAVYDSAITYITRNNGREMVVLTELGGGKADDIDGINNSVYDDVDDGKKHYVMGSAQCERDASSFSFAIQALKGTFNSDGDHGPMLPPLKHPSSDNEVVISPPRSRLLQFGKGDGSSAGGSAASERKYRTVRESYSYSLQDGSDTSDISEKEQIVDTSRFDLIRRLRKQKQQPNLMVEEIQTPCTVKYTRYGEAPPWYAPGRMCNLELHGRRLADDKSTSQDLSPLLSWAASKCKPSFWSGWPTISQTSTSDSKEQALAHQAVRLFSNDSRRFIVPDDDSTDTEGASWVSAAENTLSRVQSRLKRLSKSFIVSEVPT
mmetsp:Transcript_30274/g.45533  ORF Transcript_30274/g.45533 Transcript_30274/m.45533 type:complete len:504 (-) Transcript_30274:52-1563(-)